MGLLIDTGVLILAERQRTAVDFSAWQRHGAAFVSAVTASELLVGVLRAQTDAQRIRRTAWLCLRNTGVLRATPGESVLDAADFEAAR